MSSRSLRAFSSVSVIRAKISSSVGAAGGAGGGGVGRAGGGGGGGVGWAWTGGGGGGGGAGGGGFLPPQAETVKATPRATAKVARKGRRVMVGARIPSVPCTCQRIEGIFPRYLPLGPPIRPLTPLRPGRELGLPRRD